MNEANAEIVEMPAFRATGVRGDLTRAAETGGRLAEVAGPAGLFGLPGVLMASVMPVAILSHGPEDQHYDAVVLIPEASAVPVELPSDFIEEAIPGGCYAKWVYMGPYEGLGEAWGQFAGEWLAASGHELSGEVCFEIYRNSPDDTRADELRTELYIPVA